LEYLESLDLLCLEVPLALRGDDSEEDLLIELVVDEIINTFKYFLERRIRARGPLTIRIFFLVNYVSSRVLIT